jgi:putative toxin-antitoxin system antitoxin component (TIGR02293 family)
MMAMIERIWHDEAGARRFLNTPHPELDGRTPLEVAVTEAGAARVEELIERGRHGLPV